MTSSNAWAEFAALFLRTRSAHLEHEAAKAELKGLVPADARQALGHGIRARRSKSGVSEMCRATGRHRNELRQVLDYMHPPSCESV